MPSKFIIIIKIMKTSPQFSIFHFLFVHHEEVKGKASDTPNQGPLWARPSARCTADTVTANTPTPAYERLRAVTWLAQGHTVSAFRARVEPRSLRPRGTTEFRWRRVRSPGLSPKGGPNPLREPSSPRTARIAELRSLPASPGAARSARQLLCQLVFV